MRDIHKWQMTTSHYYYYYYYYQDEWPESNSKRNKVKEESKGTTKTRTANGREKGKKWHIHTGTQSPRTPKEEEVGDRLFFLCRTQLGTVLMPYPWIDNSTSQERRGRCTGIIIICIHNSLHPSGMQEADVVVLLSFVWFSFGQYIIHLTRHTHASSLTNIQSIIIVL